MTDEVAFQSFTLAQNQNTDLNFTVNGGADVTSSTFRFAMSRSPVSSTIVIDSNASPQTATIDTTQEASGIITVSLTATNTATLRGDYYYELKMTDILGDPQVAARGYISFEPAIT